MAGERPGQDVYGAYGGSPNVQPNQGATPNLSVRANAGDFGGQIAGAVEGAGKQGFEIANQFATMATEARANDDYANKYVPAALQLKNQYDMLDSQDKVKGYQDYVGGLQDLNKNFSSPDNGTSSLYQQHMSALINKHIEGEESAANNELVKSQIKFNGQAQADLTLANTATASANYSNPQIAKTVNDQNDALITMQHIDQGYDPNNPNHQESIETAQKLQQGQVAVGRISGALSKGDIHVANDIRAQNSDVIPASQQLHQDNILHQANMSYFSDSGTHALVTGQPVPNAPGYPSSQVQATVADAATKQGVDPNHALAILQIESSNGQHLGKRGTIGQTGNSTTLEGQASDLVLAAKNSQQAADKALGRPSEPWEQYICYQQGAMGGTTLLKGARDNPSAKAVDLLTDVYGNRKNAMSAIVNNGGNATMTSGDFLNFIQQKYAANAQRSQCTTPTANLTGVSPSDLASQSAGQAPADLGTSIRAADVKVSDAVQPAVTPRQQLIEFDKKYNGAMEVAMAQPNGVKRDALIEGLNARRAQYQGNSTRYSEQLIGGVQTKLTDPNFKDINQLTPEEQSELAINHPQTLKEARERAEANLKYGYKQASRITDVNSPNFYTSIQRSLSDNTGSFVSNSLASEGQLHNLLGREDGTGINLKDYKDLQNSFSLDNNWKQFVSAHMTTIKNANGNLDGGGEQRANDFYFAANQAKDEYLKDPSHNINDIAISDDDNPIMKLVSKGFVSKEKQVGNVAKAIQTATPLMSPIPENVKYKPGESAEDVQKRLDKLGI